MDCLSPCSVAQSTAALSAVSSSFAEDSVDEHVSKKPKPNPVPAAALSGTPSAQVAVLWLYVTFE
jgi:hypothetical protein